MDDNDRHGVSTSKELKLKKPPEEWFVFVTEGKEDVNTANNRE